MTVAFGVINCKSLAFGVINCISLTYGVISPSGVINTACVIGYASLIVETKISEVIDEFSLFTVH